MNQPLERLKHEIATLRRGSKDGYKRPHKLVLLLAVLEIIDETPEFNNRLPLDENLIKRFERQFNLYRSKDDLCQPAPPFFHLRSSSFWKHKVYPGKEAAYARTPTSGGGRKRIDELIEYAYFADWAYQVVADKPSRDELRRFIMQVLERE